MRTGWLSLPLLGARLLMAGPAVEPFEVAQQAEAAYNASNFARCSTLYQQALGVVSSPQPGWWYSLACCQARVGQPDAAFASLLRAAEQGFRYAAPMQEDEDLATLRGDARWAAVVEAVKAADARHQQQLSQQRSSDVHPELKALFDAQLAEASANPAGAAEREAQRRQRIREMLSQGLVKSAADHYHAASVLLTGSSTEELAQARDLAAEAMKLDPTLLAARQVYATAMDRWLWSQDKPQIYGTQFKRSGDGPWSLEPFDRAALTDDERRKMGMPPLVEVERRLLQLNPPAGAPAVSPAATP